MHRLAMVADYPETVNIIKGGVEAVAVILAEKFAQDGNWEVHVLAPSLNHRIKEYRNGVHVHWIKLSKVPGFISYWTIFRMKLHRKLKLLNPDITHFQGVAGYALFYKKSFVLTIHGILEKEVFFSGKKAKWLRYKIISTVERIARQKAKDVIVINPYVQSELVGQIKGRIWNIPNPVDNRFFYVENDRKSDKIIYVGCVSELKNITGLINAFAEAIKQLPALKLYICGESKNIEYTRTCVNLITELDIDNSIYFLGNIDRDRLIQELSESACLILVSNQEVAPMVVEEAMAVGVPVIASNICGLPYMIKNGETGYLVDCNDKHDIANNIIKLLSNVSHNSLMGGVCRSYAKENYHVDSVCKKTQEVYSKIINDNDTV